MLASLTHGDGVDDVVWMARKIASLRLFGDAVTSNPQSVAELGAAVLAISQFTLVADCRKGRRPSYDRAMASAPARALFERLVGRPAVEIATVATGTFGTTMHVRLVNDGPYTLVIESPARDRCDERHGSEF